MPSRLLIIAAFLISAAPPHSDTSIPRLQTCIPINPTAHAPDAEGIEDPVDVT